MTSTPIPGLSTQSPRPLVRETLSETISTRSTSFETSHGDRSRAGAFYLVNCYDLAEPSSRP